MTDMPSLFAYTRNKSQLGNVNIEKASVLKFVIGLLLLFGLPIITLAADCAAHLGELPRIKSSLQVSTLTVPRDMPTGTVIYQQQVIRGAPADYQLKCQARSLLPGDFGTSYSITPRGGLVGGSLRGVYETGVKGIGVKWDHYLGPLTPNREDNLKSVENACGSYGGNITPAGYCLTGVLGNLGDTDQLIVSLIKTGPVGSGVIDGSTLGEIQRDVRVEGYTPKVIMRASIAGRIDVVSRTCKAPDVNVSMGSYKVSDFLGIGSEIGTGNFRIELLDCPGFPGNYRAGAVSNESGVVAAALLSNNYISIQIDPVITPIDASTGILALTPGNGAAKGVGVKISRIGNLNGPIGLSQQFPVVSVNSGVSSAPLDGSTTSVSLPFSASYVQVKKKVTPGKANAVATFTINYQ